MPESTTHVHVAIIGSGFGGLGAAIRLKQAGKHDFLVFERAGEIGGTWRDNTYPGCACDVPSHLYSFSFAPNPDWTRHYAPRAEIQAYLRRCAERSGVLGHVRLGHEVVGASWEDDRRRWRVVTTRGTFTAAVLVAAGGPLSDPAVPDLPGLDRFDGVAFHSARWDHDHDLTGRDVAVIGTGASAVQFVPQIQPRAGRLRVFQRTPPWVLPRGDRVFSPAERALFRTVPAARRLARARIYWTLEARTVGFLRPRLMRGPQRVALRHLRRSVPDPALRARLVPGYTLGCKRTLLSDDYLPALTRPNVELVTEAIQEVRPHGIVTADGVEHPADTIIFGTGFHVSDLPIAERIRGRDGRTLAEVWQGSPRAYLGTTASGFPNCFLLLGPNTGLGHTSVVLMIEAQLDHLLRVLAWMRRDGLDAVEPRAGAERAFVAEVDRRMRATVWAAGGCASWYQDPTGRVSAIWPGTTRSFRRRLRRLDRAHYETVPARAVPAPATTGARP